MQTLSAKDAKPDANAIIKRFKEEKFPQILVSVNMLDTGFDCPEVVYLVMARFTKSGILYRRCWDAGRARRPHRQGPCRAAGPIINIDSD